MSAPRPGDVRGRPGRRRPARAAQRGAALVLLLAASLAGGGAARADGADGTDEKGGPADEEPGLFGRMGEAVDSTRDRASERFTDFVSSVDGFFADGTDSAISNESWARIRVEAVKPGGESLGFDGTVKLRVVLPQAQQRFRLLFSSEDDEVSGVGEDGVARSPRIESESGGQDVSLALRFIRTARATSRVNFDLGLRQRQGLIQLFGRLNTVAESEIGGGWSGRAANSFYYYAKSGYEDRLRLDLSRPLLGRENVYFRTSTGLDWLKGLKGASFSETIGLYGDLGERTAIALEGLAGYSTAVNEGVPRFRGTQIRVRFRQSVWRPWFFYEVWPSVAWPSSTDYEQVWGGLLRVEVILGQQGG